MHQNYLDAMAMVRAKGKPDYFITFTANPGFRKQGQTMIVSNRGALSNVRPAMSQWCA